MLVLANTDGLIFNVLNIYLCLSLHKQDLPWRRGGFRYIFLNAVSLTGMSWRMSDWTLLSSHLPAGDQLGRAQREEGDLD